MSRSFPVCAELAWWSTAWLRGDCGLTDVTDRALRLSPVHTTHALAPGPWSNASTGLAQLLVELADAGARGAALALPVPAQLNGLAGPAALNRDAVEAGQALLLLGEGVGEVIAALVPHTVGAGTSWAVHAAARRPPADVGQADRTLRSELLVAAETLASLDVASWSPDVADVVMNLQRADRPPVPDGIPEIAVHLAARSQWLLDVVETALEDVHDGAVSGSEARARLEALQTLGAAARTGVVAACSSDAWPT